MVPDRRRGVAVEAGDRGAASAGAARAVVAVVAAVVAPEEVLALHLALEARDVAVAKVVAQLLHLLQLEEVYPEDLNRLDHLHAKIVLSVKHESVIHSGKFSPGRWPRDCP